VISNPRTSPLRLTPDEPNRHRPRNWQQKGVAVLRIIFGFVLVVAATLKWQPQFQNTFVDQVSAAKAGQTPSVQVWISFWTNLVSINPLLFARIEASTETALAVFVIFGVFSNLSYTVGFLLSLGIWSIPEGFGGPYVPGKSTDVGTAFPYAILFAFLLCVSAGRYYGVDKWLTPKLGRFGVLASGSRRKGYR
jgi:thiosulfate dehydrogenase (quinone) large subunit